MYNWRHSAFNVSIVATQFEKLRTLKKKIEVREIWNQRFVKKIQSATGT